MKADKSDSNVFPPDPVIYEINTLVWLRELSVKYRKRITLSNVPGKEYDALSSLRIDAIWLMGVWKRSPAGLEIAKNHEGIMNDLREALPDLEESDIAGSPYCIKDYQVEKEIGGEKGLATARKQLAERHMKLILDFVPNHVAPDHPWTTKFPEYFISINESELINQPDGYYAISGHIYAKARDPFYPPWPDVLQLNLFNEKLRTAMIQTLESVASRCDGIRCDMAMLVMNEIFQKTWAEKAGPVPEKDFWDLVIPAVKSKHPNFIFIAEAYWETEPALISQGFDLCYDKRFYDYLKEGAGKARHHLADMLHYQENLLRFLENHDEPRAAGLFEEQRNMALALASMTLPGAKLIHDGQMEGRTVKVPVFLTRRRNEQDNQTLMKFYALLLKILHYDAVKKGSWSPCPLSGWHDNQSCQNMMAWEWVCDHENLMIVINLSDQPSQARVKSSYPYIPGRTYQLFDVISGELYRRDGEELTEPGLYVVLKGWGAHTLSIEH
jgi:glycosidase